MAVFRVHKTKNYTLMSNHHLRDKDLSLNGFVVNKALTSLKMINYMRNNTAMQTAVLGAANKRLLTKQELANLLMQEYGITIDRCDENFRFRKADGSLKTGRYFKVPERSA